MQRREDSTSAARASLRGQVGSWTRQVVDTFALVGVGLLLLLVGNQVVFAPAVRDSVEAARLSRLQHEAMLNEESGLRAYLFTRDTRFLEPYEEGRAVLEDIEGRLEGLVGGTRDSDLLLAVRLAQQDWITGWAPLALEAGHTRTPQADLDVLLDDGKELFDEYRVAQTALNDALIARRTRAIDRQALAIGWTAGVALLLTVATGALFWHRGRRMRRSLDDPLEAILQHLDRVRAGDLAPLPAVAGPEELVRISEGLRATTATLAEARHRGEAQQERILAQNQNLGQVLRVAREIAGSLNLRYVVRGVTDAAAAITGHRVVIWLRGTDGDLVEALADSAGPGMEPLGVDPVGLGEGMVGRAARFGRIEGRHGRLHSDQADGEELAVPMVVGAQVIGVLQVLGEGVADLPADTVDVIEALAVQAASAVASARLYEDTERLARTDALTQLPNRRQLDEDLNTEGVLALRHRRPLCFAMIDVDHFKAYNDALGHQAGDVALQALAGVLAERGRTGDRVYRFGGEEIALLLRETDAAGGREVLERLRAAVEHHFSAPGQPRPVTISAGVAALPEHASSTEALVRAADEALYEAKQAGRNRICVASPLSAAAGTSPAAAEPDQPV